MKNNLLLRRNLSVYVAKANETLPDAYLGAALRNIERLGFTFSGDLIHQVRTLSVDSFISFYETTVSTLREMVGDNVRYVPFYPNFPRQVEEMPELTLYINAILHYLTLDKPMFEVKERFPMIESTSLKVIQLANEQDFSTLMTRLFGSKTSLSPFDKEDILSVIELDGDCLAYVPSEFVHKENMSFILSALLKNNRISDSEVITHIRTATDVLRLAVGMSEGDVSLSKPSRFRKFTRKERRLFLHLLERLFSYRLLLLGTKRNYFLFMVYYNINEIGE